MPDGGTVLRASVVNSAADRLTLFGEHIGNGQLAETDFRTELIGCQARVILC